ncbi:MAG: VWA domain-containing protein [Planctomycetaceae bacterium]
MSEPLGRGAGETKDQLSVAINNGLLDLIIRSTNDFYTKDLMDIGVLGYRTDQHGNPIVESALVGPLAGRDFVSIAEIEEDELRLEHRSQLVTDRETGEVRRLSEELPVWVDGIAEGGTPMCHALLKCHQMISDWIVEHPDSYPPFVINITGSESQDGDPVPYAESVRALETSDGNVLLFNCHLSGSSPSVSFPAFDRELPNLRTHVLFDVSSPLPLEFVLMMGLGEIPTPSWNVQPDMRGFAFNADKNSLENFLETALWPPRHWHGRRGGSTRDQYAHHKDLWAWLA